MLILIHKVSIQIGMQLCTVLWLAQIGDIIVYLLVIVCDPKQSKCSEVTLKRKLIQKITSSHHLGLT